MTELKLPRDLESRSDFRLFRDAVGQAGGHATLPLFIFTKFWFQLGYQAEVTQRPGLLNKSGESLLRSDVKDAGQDGEVAIEALVTGELLVKTEDGLFCPLFSRLNEHLSPKHKRSCDVGNEHSRIKRNEKNLLGAAVMQQQLIPPEAYKKADGTELTAADMTRLTVMVLTLDHCFRIAGRLKTTYTEGLVADAARADDIIRTWPDGERDQFYYWLNDHREEPWMHKTAELILRHFPTVVEQFKNR